MSLILDALNRAEQERKRQDQVPDIHTIHRSPAMSLGEAARTRRRLLIAGVLLILLVIIGLCVWFFRLSQPAVAEQQLIVSTPAPPVSVPALPQQSIAKTPVQAVPQTEVAPQPASLSSAQQQPATDTAKADINNLYAAGPEADTAKADVPGPVTELYQEKAPEESESVTTPFPETESMRDLPPGKIRSLDEFPNMPFFNDLPWNLKQQIPTISYSRHNYLPNAVSTVVINGATRGIGNLAPGEFIVEDILSDGVILRHKDKVFKLPALSGWVNM